MTDLSSPELELELELDLEAVYGWRTSSKAFCNECHQGGRKRPSARRYDMTDRTMLRRLARMATTAGCIWVRYSVLLA